MDAWLGESFGALESAMRFRLSRQAVLASNIANADTPHYRRRDLQFDAVLAERMGRVVRTSPSHLPQPSGPERYRQELGPRGTRPDGNGVDLDNELVAANRNAGAFSDQAAILTRMTRLVHRAIGGS